MFKIVVLLLVVGLIEVYSTTEHNHKYEPSRRSDILSNLNQRLKSMRRTNDNFEGCCDGLDPVMLQEVQQLSQNFGLSWESIMQKYNMEQFSLFVQTLDVINEAISNLNNVVDGLNTEPSALPTDGMNLMTRMNDLLLRRTKGKRSLRRNDASGGFYPQMLEEVEELISNFCKSWEEIMEKYKVKPIAQFTSTLDTITQAFEDVKHLISGIKTGAPDDGESTLPDELEPPVSAEDLSVSSETVEPETDYAEIELHQSNSNENSDPGLMEEVLADDFIFEGYQRAINDLNKKIEKLAQDLTF